MFKRLITGEPVPARDVYRSATTFCPDGAARVFDQRAADVFGWGRRRARATTAAGSFNRVVPEDERDPDLTEHILRDESDLLLHFAVEGACRLIRQRDFTLPASSQELLQRLGARRRPGAGLGSGPSGGDKL